jgi:hypothetical protein
MHCVRLALQPRTRRVRILCMPRAVKRVRLPPCARAMVSVRRFLVAIEQMVYELAALALLLFGMPQLARLGSAPFLCLAFFRPYNPLRKLPPGALGLLLRLRHFANSALEGVQRVAHLVLHQLVAVRQPASVESEEGGLSDTFLFFRHLAIPLDTRSLPLRECSIEV